MGDKLLSLILVLSPFFLIAFFIIMWIRVGETSKRLTTTFKERNNKINDSEKLEASNQFFKSNELYFNSSAVCDVKKLKDSHIYNEYGEKIAYIEA